MAQLENTEVIDEHFWLACRTVPIAPRPSSPLTTNRCEVCYPSNECQDLDNVVLGQLMCTLDPEDIKQASGGIFGRIYKYLLFLPHLMNSDLIV